MSRVGAWIFERNGNAVASVLLAVAGLLEFGVILGPIAVGLGLIGARQIRDSFQPGRNLAVLGIVLGIIGFAWPIARMVW